MNLSRVFRFHQFHFLWTLLLMTPFMLSGCYLIETMQQEPLPTNTPLPAINLTMLPVLPTLPPLVPTETPVPEAQIRFETDDDLFSRTIPEQIPSKGNQPAGFAGTVSESALHSYQVRHASGVVFDVTCDDFCFYVDGRKKLTDPEKIETGTRVLVFGTAAVDDPLKVNADAIAADIADSGNAAGSRLADPASFPYPLEYTEYELKSPPGLNPLTLNPIEGSLDQNLKDRLQTPLSNRTNYIYGLYGEAYSTTIEYDQTENRDPLYPTRAHLQVESNSYVFYDFWFPYVESPYFRNWGIMSFGGDWYLPIRMTVDIDPDPLVSELIYSDRTIMSQLNFDRTNGYYRSFGFSILSDMLFYFYENEKGYGVSLNRADFDLGFDEILFGMVDRYQELNPFYSDKLVSFLARRGDTWYYAEIEAAETESPYYY